jgi:hypothetical protein
MKENSYKLVVSLELAKQLKELGFEQDSLFYWVECINDELPCFKVPHISSLDKVDDDDLIICSAYTVAELGEMLPASVITETLINKKSDGAKWFAMKYDDELNKDGSKKMEYVNELGDNKFRARYEADARAKMLIYLKKNNLI